MAIRAYCTARGWDGLTFYADNGISAFTDRPEKRPAILDGIERDAMMSRKATAKVSEYQVMGRVIMLTFVSSVLLGNGRLPTAITASNL